MGTYNISNDEILSALDEALDNLEGDFTNRQLLDCLEVMQLYPFVNLKNKSVPEYVKAKQKLVDNPKYGDYRDLPEKNYEQCKFCGKQFIDLKKHINKVHGGKEQNKLK